MQRIVPMSALLIIPNNPLENNAAVPVKFFLDKDASGFYEWHDWSAEKGLERLVFKVSRTPKYLQAHMERIYYCFQENLGEQLFAALADLMLVLGKDGGTLVKRMIAGSKSKLTEAQHQELLGYLESNVVGNDGSFQNPYSVFAKGLESTQAMLKLPVSNPDMQHDPLALARDYIEFNQLDDATSVLEQAIMEQPERLELHNELLALYRSTHNKSSFINIFNVLSNKELLLPPAWEQLSAFFGLSDHGKK